MKKAICLLFFIGACSKFDPTISGLVSLGGTSALERLAGQPNVVCYLILKDQWGVPVASKRWLNPKFPIHFALTKTDLLLPTRPWEGPYQLEAYLFLSLDPNHELPPPPGAAIAIFDKPISPGNSALELVLHK